VHRHYHYNYETVLIVSAYPYSHKVAHMVEELLPVFYVGE
jgi:hypothetical protein